MASQQLLRPFKAPLLRASLRRSLSTDAAATAPKGLSQPVVTMTTTTMPTTRRMMSSSTSWNQTSSRLQNAAKVDAPAKFFRSIVTTSTPSQGAQVEPAEPVAAAKPLEEVVAEPVVEAAAAEPVVEAAAAEPVVEAAAAEPVVEAAAAEP